MKEIQEKAHYIAITGIIRNAEGKYLICKRSPHEKIYPGKWCVPGGKVQQSDFINTKKDTQDHWFNVFEKVLAKEVREETGLEIKNIGYVANFAMMRPNGFSTLIVSLHADHASGDVKLDESELVDFAWISPQEAYDYDMIEHIDNQIVQVDEMHKKNQI